MYTLEVIKTHCSTVINCSTKKLNNMLKCSEPIHKKFSLGYFLWFSLWLQQRGHVEHNELETGEFKLLCVVHGGKLQQLCSVFQSHWEEQSRQLHSGFNRKSFQKKQIVSDNIFRNFHCVKVCCINIIRNLWSQPLKWKKSDIKEAELWANRVV